MTERLLFAFLLLALSSGSANARPLVAALQSVRIPPYEEALEGFSKACDAEIERIVFSELKERSVAARIRAVKPNLILALGPDALRQAQQHPNIPLVYLMVLDPLSMVGERKNIAGIGMTISAQEQLRVLTELLPQARTVGLLYDPQKSADWVEKAQEAAGRAGLKLIARTLASPKGVPAAMMALEGRIDVFWMLPEVTLITPEAVEFMLLFSLRTRIPILTFSQKYVELGALASIGIDAFDIGVQAGEMVNRILGAAQLPERSMPGAVDPRKPVLSINPKIARKLGIEINETLVQQGKVVE